MQTVNLDWSQLQVQGITDTLKKYGVTVTGVASAEYQVDKQIADIENTIQQHPDGIISIPVDFTATAPTYKKVVAGRHQARVHGQHPDRPEASRGICDDGLGRQPGQWPDRGADPGVLRAEGRHDRSRQFRRRLFQHQRAHQGRQRVDEEEPARHQDEAGRLHRSRRKSRRSPATSSPAIPTSRACSRCGTSRRSTR